MNQKILHSALNLLEYIESENYRGYDPYDALKSPLFKLPFFNKNKIVRFGFQQLVKRSPVNLRPLLLVPKGYNPVTLGLCIQAYGYLSRVLPERKEEFFAKADYLIEELKKLIPQGFSGACWGYDFDWEARYAKIPAYQPTVVATGIITNGLFEYYKISANEEAFRLCESASDFVLKDLNRTYEGETFSFSYSPFDRLVVFNASMKGVRLLSQVYSITKRKDLFEAAAKSAAFVVNHQNDDGSWFYGDNSTAKWIDNYHTGYVLDCLDEFNKLDDSKKFDSNLKKGVSFYVQNFFEDERIPKFYHNKKYPVDCTSASQSLLTLTRFNHMATAKKVAEFIIEHMQNKKGYFYFRDYGNKFDRSSFMRWSNAWMLAGLTFIILANKQNLN